MSYSTKWTKLSIALLVSKAVLISVRRSTLTSPCDESPGFQNSLPGLNWVLQPSFIVQGHFKTLAVTSSMQWQMCYMKSQIYKMLYWSHKSQLQCCVIIVFSWWNAASSFLKVSVGQFVLILLSVTWQHNTSSANVEELLQPLENYFSNPPSLLFFTD